MCAYVCVYFCYINACADMIKFEVSKGHFETFILKWRLSFLTQMYKNILKQTKLLKNV